MKVPSWSWLGIPIGALSMVVVSDLGGSMWGGLALGVLLVLVAALASESTR